MQSIFKFIYITLAVMVLTGCSGKDREFNDYSYLDYDTIEYLEAPRENGVYDKYNDITKENKKDFVRWTATVNEVKYDDQIRLIEQGLPEIRANFNEKVTEDYDIKKGEVITVSCKLDGYNYVIWDKPRWWLKKCEIEETTEEDKIELLAYQNAVKEKNDEKTTVLNKQKEEEALKIKEEEKIVKEQEEKTEKQKQIAEEQESIKVAENKEYLKTPAGKKEYLADTQKKLGAAELVDIRNPEGNYWVVEVNDGPGISAKLNRSSRIRSSATFFETVFSESENFETVLVIWNAELHDLKGNVSVGTVMEIELTAENAKSINWDNFSAKNLPDIADGFWEIPPKN